MAELVVVQRERAKTLREIAEVSRYFYRDFEAYDEKAAAKHLSADLREPFSDLRERLAALDEWNAEAIHQALVEVAESRGLKLGKLAQPLRVALTGGSVSPSIDATTRLMGRERTLQRIDRAITYMAERG